jgi:TolB protein
MTRAGLVLAVALTLGTPTADAAFPGRDGLIAFVADGNVRGLSGRGIAVIRPDGSGLRLLTRSRHDRHPAWSADGTRLVFDRRGDVYGVRANGTQLRRLTRGSATDTEPTWSPGGGRIAFLRNDALFIMRSDGSGLRRVYPARSRIDGPVLDGPSWSPNGKWIAFGEDDGDGGSIIVMSPDGVRRTSPATGEEDDYQPDWSPDGRWIAFTRVEWLCPRCDVVTVWMTSADGATTPRITDDGEDPSWAPGGGRLVALTANRGLVVFDLNGQSRVLLPVGGFQPAWQPRR